MFNLSAKIMSMYSHRDGLSNDDLDSIFRSCINKYNGYTYCGCYPKNKIPRMVGDNWFCIVNMSDDKSHGKELPGTHWMAMGRIRGTPFYFDSYGVIPPTEIESYFPDKENMVWSHKEIQELGTPNCGFFCVAACLWLCRKNGESCEEALKSFLDQFDHKNYAYNDVILYKLLT